MSPQTVLIAALACGGLHLAGAAQCTEVKLKGPFAPGRLMKCVNGLLIRRSTDPNSCPRGWKIWAPESRQDWATVINTPGTLVKNPHLIVDVTRPSNGCGSGCRQTMNSDITSQSSWKTTNGERWWLRSSRWGEPSGNYQANCYLHVQSFTNPDDIRFDDNHCHIHSRDYLCQPEVKVDCTNRTDEITGPCKSEAAIFRHSNCTPGVCDQGKYLMFKGTTSIDDCKQLCSDGRTYSPVPSGLVEKIYYFRQNGRYHDVTGRTPDQTRIVDTINYPSTGGHWSGFKNRDHFYVRWEANFKITQAGSYRFFTSSDDGSRLWVDGTQLIDNGGWHGMRERSGAIDLTAGDHALIVEAFEGGGGAGMIAKWQGPDSNNQKQLLPNSMFVSSSGTQYTLSGLFKNSGPCMAYSMTADETCLIYTQCPSVGTGSTCDPGLDFLGDLSGYKTCRLSAPAAPGGPSGYQQAVF